MLAFDPFSPPFHIAQLITRVDWFAIVPIPIYWHV